MSTGWVTSCIIQKVTSVMYPLRYVYVCIYVFVFCCDFTVKLWFWYTVKCHYNMDQIVSYCINNYRDWGRISVRCWVHNLALKGELRGVFVNIWWENLPPYNSTTLWSLVDSYDFYPYFTGIRPVLWLDMHKINQYPPKSHQRKKSTSHVHIFPDILRVVIKAYHFTTIGYIWSL